MSRYRSIRYWARRNRLDQEWSDFQRQRLNTYRVAKRLNGTGRPVFCDEVEARSEEAACRICCLRHGGRVEHYLIERAAQ